MKKYDALSFLVLGILLGVVCFLAGEGIVFVIAMTISVFVAVCCIVVYKIKDKLRIITMQRNRYKGTIYESRKVEKLAKRCEMGDIVAMRNMAYFFRNCCEKKLQRLLDAYELNPVQQNEDAIENYLKMHFKEERIVAAYMMWLVRAAFYGNENANLLIGKCPYYQRKALIPYSFYINGASQSIGIWVSRDIGMIDMVQGEDNGGRLTYCREKGCYNVYYLCRYEPPDETGFGAEWEYDIAYYDEFFCRIPTGNEKEISQKMFLLEQEREAYWAVAKHQASKRKYTRRMYIQEQEVM